MSIRDEYEAAASKHWAETMDKVMMNAMTNTSTTNTVILTSLDDPLEDSKLDDPSEQFKTLVHNAAFMEKVFRGLGIDISKLNTMTVNEFLQICAEKQVWLEHGESESDKKRREHEQKAKLERQRRDMLQRMQPLSSRYIGPAYDDSTIFDKFKKWVK